MNDEEYKDSKYLPSDVKSSQKLYQYLLSDRIDCEDDVFEQNDEEFATFDPNCILFGDYEEVQQQTGGGPVLLGIPSSVHQTQHLHQTGSTVVLATLHQLCQALTHLSQAQNQPHQALFTLWIFLSKIL